MKGTLLLFSTVSIFLISHSFANDKKTSLATNCDRDGMPGLSDEEYMVYLLHQDPIFDAKDTNYDGKISPEEEKVFDENTGEKHLEKVRKAARKEFDREKVARPNQTIRPVAVVDDMYGTGIPEERNLRKELWGIQIVKNFDQVTRDPRILDDAEQANEAFEKASPATFGYSYDYNQDGSTVQAVGSVAKVFTLFPSIPIVTGASFDRVSNSLDSNKNKDEDSLIFRFGSGSEFGATGPIVRQQVRLNANYVTDFDFEKEVIAGDADWEPLFNLPGNQKYYYLPIIKFSWRAYLHAEFGGSVSNADPNDDFIRIGPNISTDIAILLRPDEYGHELNDRVHLNVSYLYYPNLLNGADARLLQAALIGYLDKSQHFSLNLEYDRGTLPLSEVDEDRILISLGVKF